MTDIVERLRAAAFNDAADEIERLAKRWNDYRIAHESVAKDNERLEVEIERLERENTALRRTIQAGGMNAAPLAEIERLRDQVEAWRKENYYWEGRWRESTAELD